LRNILLITILLCLTSSIGLAQITASATQGCAPLTNVAFSHTYTGATNINWSFGDGASAIIPNPTHTFTLPGTYNVVFTASVNGSNVNHQLTITVHPNPVSSFTINGITNGCVGLQVSFTSNSTGGGGSAITNWNWAFGDGGVNASNTPTPNYQYNVGGIFDVGLIVTDANGCNASSIQEDQIIISGLPTVNLTSTPSPASACIAPLVVAFNSNASSNSPLTPQLTYEWNMGNGETFNTANTPNITYDEEGTYNVTLIVTDDNDCSRTVTTVAAVSSPIADFTVVGGENDTVCQQVVFINNSTGTSPTFQYGDGQSGVLLWHYYENAGWYDVTLTVNNGQCQDDTTIAIYVQIPTVTVTSSVDTICQFPHPVQFFATGSHPIATHYWNLPSGGVSTNASPIDQYGYPENEYQINEFGHPGVKVTITTTDGCTAEGVTNFVVYRPNALFYPTLSEGCSPLQLAFYDSSHTATSNITQWQWHFDDDSAPITSNNDDPIQHTYTAPGIYHPYLIIHTANGCKDTSWVHTIEVGSPPNASFTISPTTVCIGDVIQIIDTTPEADNVDTWHYSGDHNMLFSCQNEPDPQVSFNSQTGTSTITMTAGFRGCYSTATQQINVNGPIGKLSYSCNCDAPLTYPFTADVSDATHWSFDFGDGQNLTNTTSTHITHTYNATGDYWVTLTSYNANSGCAPHIDSVLVKVRQVEAIINLPDVICKDVDFAFNATASIDGASQEGSCYNSFIWDFGDNTPPKTTSEIYTRKYEQSGYFTVELFAEDINGCIDSTSKLVRVAGVDADFDMTYNGICLPLTVNLQAQASGDLNITGFNWYYNDESSSTGQTSSHTFTDPIYNSDGVLEYFYVTLEVVDEAGCITTVKDSVMANIPNSNFQNLTPINICEGGSVTFKPLLSQTGNQFQWNFGDGSTSTTYQVNHSFAQTGFYTISLTTTNSSGCSYTKVMENMVHVQDKPIAAFMASIPDDETICYPAQLTFTDTSIVNPFGSRTWDLGNGAPSIGTASIGANYNEPGLYTVTLISRTTAGCADTIAKTIQVEGPIGNFNLSPTTICRGKSIQLSISDTSDVATWQWDYGDGTHGGQVNQHAHQYDFNFNPTSGQTVISLVLWNADSTCNAVISKNINFVDARAGFKRNNELTALDSIHCYGIADIFTNTSTSNIVQWHWNFGNGQTHNGMTPPPVTFDPGTYSVQLAVRTAVNPGCVDTLQKTMIIHPLPVVQTNGGAICIGDEIQIFANGGISYAWSPTETLSDAQDQNPIAFPTTTTTYTVSVTDENDCVNTETATVVVYQPIQTVNNEQSIIIGESQLLNAYQGEGYTYQWSPNYNIDCLDCAEVWVMPMVDTTYRVIITDLLGCYTDTSYYHVKVLPWTSVDVPDVFTPNGDGTNDIIYVKGWGIEKLHYFKIFNRWGELVFESNDINHGWNGYYKDKLQMADTYSYIVSVKYYLKEAPEEKSGFINIIR
jgi:gliding motility-associated-like protein